MAAQPSRRLCGRGAVSVKNRWRRQVGVQSRAELVAALYVRHYEPRRTAGSTPGPYGWYLDDYQAAAG